ncbi:hypothetical protein GCM10011505_24840 [Tistrella bauzanensis]|uniref:LysM domain-containing protein n=1 Tax=Tistrella bauzanensis TaxID=657419 RepID=A0ABQ1ILS6_9PROT|nr:hypothetical protein [Tistrella bauzanensis]GGB42500.1 hypothetical protein GCM10011505_24840 [Tistrella bauzanensis]
MSAAMTVTADAAMPGSVDMTVGYTDPVIGVAAWPVTTASWAIQPPAEGQSGAVLAMRVAMQPGGLVPPPVAAGDAAAATATDIASRFGAVWYQVMQPDMQVVLSTALNQPAGGDPVALPTTISGLRAHVSGCYAFSAAAASFAAAFADPAVTATLADVVDHYGLDWQALGLAAGERLLGSLLVLPESGLLVPSFAVFQAGGTVAALVPAPLDPAAVLGDDDNIVLPLNPGSELVVPSAERAQPEDGLPLADLALALNITLASLVTANADRPGLLAPGFVFSAQGIEVEVPATGEPGADATFEDIALAFTENGVPFDAVMAAGSSAETLGMFRSGVTLTVDRQIIAAGWTLATNTTTIDATTLAGLNTATIDLFPAGVPLFLKADAVTGLDTAPLGATARAYAIEPGDLLRHNAGLAPMTPAPDGSAGLPVAGLAAWSLDPADLRIPYRIPGGQTMTAIAALFLAASTADGITPEQALTQANRALPGTVAGGRTITVSGQPLATEAGDSFDDVIARADPPVTIIDFADAIADDPLALAAGGLLLCPPAVLDAAGPATPADLVARYGVDATLVLSANAATPGVIAAGVTLKPSPVADTPTIVTAAADSMNAILHRFAAAGIAVTIGDVVQGNPDTAFLAAGAQLLLPPVDTTLTAAFGEGGWQVPGVIFPLRSWVTLARNPDLVDPAFRGTDAVPGPVVQEASPLAAARSATPERQENGAVTLDVFAAAIEEVIEGLKLATGRVLSAERDPSPTDIWAVSFIDPGGITQVDIAPTSELEGVEGKQPFSFALRPLSNTLEAESGVEIRTLDPATGQWGDTRILDYQGVDLEVWARAWLSGMDLICTAPYAAPAYRVAPSALEQLLAAKKLLACAVADGLSPVLVEQEENGGEIGGAAWTAAREVLYQRLLNQLGPAYDTTAILQFTATVTAPTEAATARLSGAGRLDPLNEAARRQRAAAGDDPDAWRVSQLGNAKTWLADTTSGTVSFPLDVAQPARHRAVALDPRYAVNEIEFDISPVVAGYDKSNWLSFVRVFDQHPPDAFTADLGAPLVPVPLRAYPDLPALVSQQALTADNPTTVEAAVHWSYVFTYTHQSAAQDQIHIELEFNRQPEMALRMGIDDDTLFAALAQYGSASDTLWQILAGLQGPDATAANTVLANTLGTYADLATRISGLWSAWWGVGSCDEMVAAQGAIRPANTGLVHPSRTAAGARRLAAQIRAANGMDAATGADEALTVGAPHEFYHYLATLDAGVVTVQGVDIDVYLTLTLQQLDADGSIAWPEITVIRDDGVAVALTGAEPGATSRVYSFPTDDPDKLVPAFTRLGFRYTIGGLHIAHYQNANAGVSVIRNAQLLGTGGPDTCSAFIYRTPQLGFPEPLVPLITIDKRLAIGTWTTDPATNPLTAVFNAMFDNDPAGREIAVAARYGYALVPGETPIETFLPVALHPRYTYDQATTVQGIITAVESWASAAQPVTTGGLWGFGISMYSSTDPALDRPLLELQRLVSPIA